MKLSCVILMCDKDWFLVEKLIQNINEKVKINKEIIVIDNREQYKNEEIDFKDAKVFSKGKNLYQLESRRWAIEELVNNDYVWFIDGDDQVCEVDNVDYTHDVICFNFTTDNESVFECTYNNEEEFFGEDVLTGYVVNSSISCLWNKWIKTDVLKKAISLIPKNEEISASEDTIFVLLSYKYAKSYIHINNVYYMYNTTHSNAVRQSYEKIEQFRAILKGHNNAYSIIMSSFSTYELDRLNINDMYYNNCSYFVNRYRYCTDDVKKEAMKALYEHFSREVLQVATLKYLFPMYVNLKEAIGICIEIEKYENPDFELTEKEKTYLENNL